MHDSRDVATCARLLQVAGDQNKAQEFGRRRPDGARRLPNSFHHFQLGILGSLFTEEDLHRYRVSLHVYTTAVMSVLIK